MSDIKPSLLLELDKLGWSPDETGLGNVWIGGGKSPLQTVIGELLIALAHIRTWTVTYTTLKF